MHGRIHTSKPLIGEPPPEGFGRDPRIDACRGIALWWIFLDHVPSNIGSWLTLRNYGFSDAAEVFMFISGRTCALAYDRARRCEGWSGVIRRSLRRGWDIYAAFLLLTLACAILVYLAGREHLTDESRKQSQAGRITNAYLRDPRQGGQPSFRKPSYSAFEPFDSGRLPSVQLSRGSRRLSLAACLGRPTARQ